MSARPTKFFIEYDGETYADPDAEPKLVSVDVPDDAAPAHRLGTEAQRRAEALSREHKQTVLVFRRISIADITPKGGPRGLVWEWDDEFVGDVTASTMSEEQHGHEGEPTMSTARLEQHLEEQHTGSRGRWSREQMEELHQQRHTLMRFDDRRS